MTISLSMYWNLAGVDIAFLGTHISYSSILAEFLEYATGFLSTKILVVYVVYPTA